MFDVVVEQTFMQINQVISVRHTLKMAKRIFNNANDDTINKLHLINSLEYFEGFCDTFPASAYLTTYNMAQKYNNFKIFNLKMLPFREEICDIVKQNIVHYVKLPIKNKLPSEMKIIIEDLQDAIDFLLQTIKCDPYLQFDILRQIIETSPENTEKFNPDDFLTNIIKHAITDN